LLPLLCSDAFAAEQCVAIVSDDAGAPMVARLEAELTGLGVASLLVEQGAGIDSITGRPDVVAAFDITPQRVSVVFSDGQGGRIERALDLPQDDALGISLVRTRATETLRAGLLEVQTSVGRRQAERLSLQELVTLEPGQTHGSIALSPWAVISGTPTQAALSVAADASYPVAERFSATGGAVFPVLRSSVEGDAGSAQVGMTAVRLGLSASLLDPSRPVQPMLTLTPGLLLLRTQGDAAPGYTDRTLTTPVPALLGGPGVRWDLGRVGLRADATAVVTRPIDIVFASAHAGRWGPLTVAASTGLDLELP